MEWDALENRIRSGENLHTEFKREVGDLNDLAAEIVAFANTDGGAIFVGVTDDGQVVGIADVNTLTRQIDNVAYNNCEPPITIVQEVFDTPEGLQVLVVKVPKGEQRPYRTNRGIYYVRTTSGRRQASREELLRLFQASGSVYYDEVPIYRADFSDLDLSSFDRFLFEAYGRSLKDWDIAPQHLLSNLRLLSNGHPTVAGVLFFGTQPQFYLPQARVVAARIPGASLAEPPMDKKSIDGRIPQICEDSLRFLQIHLPVVHRIEGLAPEAHPELPEVALREAVVNAIAHRDYTIQSPIRLFVFDDRVEIRTPGRLPNTVTIPAIKLGGAHVLRNPTIYTLLSRLGLVTGIGSGVLRIITLVREATGREPELSEEGNEFVLRIPRKEAVHSCSAEQERTGATGATARLKKRRT
ncbi:MAG TPA: transcriptional regulator [Clostridia bacterium]|nr:transcriptional regulator [Clostridia bacterium]